DDRVETPRNVPPVAEPSPQSITKPMTIEREPAPAPRGAAAALANAAPGGMTPAMREEVWTIVRAAVDQALVPVGARYKEMEAKIAALQAAPPTLASPAKAAAATSAAARLASIPVQVGSVPPAPVILKADAAPASTTVPDMRPPMPSQSVR